MGWVYLILAISFEVAGTTFMKLSEGFTKSVPSIAMFVFYILSLTALTFALKPKLCIRNLLPSTNHSA